MSKKTKEFLEKYAEEEYQRIKEEEALNQQANEEAQAMASSADEQYSELKSKRVNQKYENQKDGKPLMRNVIVPSIFAEATYLLDGRPLRLKNRKYYRFIHDADITNGLLKTARQVEKSTTFSVKIADDTLLTPFVRSLYYAPLNEQVKMFSEDRLGRLFVYSQADVIKRTFIRSADKQNVFNKSFSNGSLIYLRHCYGLGDNMRGLSVNNTYGDEIQDIDIDAIPVVQECQAHAHDLGPGIMSRWFAGTPKTFSNTIQELWNRSNQCEWIIRCPACNRDQILGLENITEHAYLCRNSKCRKPLTAEIISEFGRWFKLNESSETWGFHINQLMSPAMPVEEVFAKVNTYDKQRLFNEVLGLSYENAEKPFPPTLLAYISANDLKMMSQPQGYFNNVPIFMGVDWGTGERSYTVVYIGAYNKEGQWQLLYTHKYHTKEENERDYQVRDIARLMTIFHVGYCIADYGHGFQSNQQLKNLFKERFDAMFYSSSLGQLRIYDSQKSHWVVNRTRTIHEYVTAHKEMRVVWPGASKEEIEFLYEHHLAEQTEYKSMRPKAGQNILITRSEEMYYSHPASSPDDGMHAGVYAYTASLIKPAGGASQYGFAGAVSR